MHWTLADMLLDLVHNSVQANARTVSIDMSQAPGELTIRIADDGKGMDRLQRERALDPFYSEPGKHPGRRVGLGLPFLVQTVQALDGWYRLESEPGAGTTLEIGFDPDHVDCPPLGDLPEALAAMFTLDGEYELEFRRRTDKAGEQSEYRILRSELRDALGELETIESQVLLRDFLTSQEADPASA